MHSEYGMLMKVIASFCLILTFLFTSMGCTKDESAADFLDEISGVWRADGDATMVTIAYAKKRVSLLFNDIAIPVSVGDIDHANHTVNLNMTQADGRPAVWTIRQV